jgi:hypothetical protein
VQRQHEPQPRRPRRTGQQILSVQEALRNPQAFPQRLSLNANIPDFDRAAYLANPAAYCAEHVPARCFQAAQPGPGVKRLQSQSAYFLPCRQDQEVELVMQAEPFMPVTFTATHGGTFAESRLLSVTVRADSRGIATATFRPGTGVIADAPVFAASPSSLGVVKTVVNVSLPPPPEGASAEQANSAQH